MIQVGGTLVADDVIKKEFVCNLSACRGACCVQGDAGAPLSPEEKDLLNLEYTKIKPFLTSAGIETVDKTGVYVTDSEGDDTTPCVDGNKECAYAVFEEGTAFCGIERAWVAGVTSFQKPISCHLYPIRITQYPEFDVLNYDRWDICSPACKLGESLKIPVYQFLKKVLIRRYGVEWYNELQEQAEFEEF